MASASLRHVLCRFVDDCIAYLAGLVSTAEVLPVVRQQRDKMLTRVVIGALQQTLDALGVRDFSKAMQVTGAAANSSITCHLLASHDLQKTNMEV